MANVLTPKFRVSYPNVFKPRKNDLNGKDEYSLTALFPKGADLTALKAEAERVVKEKWGPDSKKWPANLRSPFRDQGEKMKEGTLPDGYEAGAQFINLKTEQRPGLVDQQKQDIINPSDFYAGCWARASVRAYAYDNKGNRGVAFGLQNLQKMAEGESLSSRTSAQEDFAPIETTGTTGETTSASSLFG